MSRQDAIREKRRIARARKKQIEKEQSKTLLEEDEDVLIEEKPLELDVEQKCGMDAIPDIPLPATSFEELDALEAAKERMEAAQEVSYQVQDLVRNILYSSEMNPKQKAAAIKKVGDEFSSRVEMTYSEEINGKSIDMEILELQAEISVDKRHTPLFERFADWIDKKKLTTRAENALADEQFALVYTDANGNKVRKYPIHDKAHVRNALARAAQMINEGGAAAEDARRALPKIRAAAKKMGIGVTEKSAVIVEKAADGNWRAVMFPSNNFVDWHGDIISKSAHEEYVEWVNKNMEFAPLFMTWHTPGTAREKPVDFVGYENGFLIMSAPLTEAEAAGLFRAQTLTDIGMSHTSIVLERDPKDNRVITKYRIVEVTDLPLEDAANPFTSLDLINKEAVMDTKKYLAALLGSDEKAEKYLERAGLKQKELEAAEIPSKEKETNSEPTSPTAPKGKLEADVNVSVLSMEQVIERVSKEFGITELSEQFAEMQEAVSKVPVLEALVKELSKASDEKLADMIQPPAQKSLAWLTQRSSQKSESALTQSEEDKALKKSTPVVGWLSEATGTQPIQV